MKRFITAAVLAALLVLPSSAFAGRGGYRHGHPGNALAWGILGGVVGGVILDRALLPPPRVIAPGFAPYPYAAPPYYPQPYYAAPYPAGYGYYRSAPRRSFYGRAQRGRWRGDCRRY